MKKQLKHSYSISLMSLLLIVFVTLALFVSCSSGSAYDENYNDVIGEPESPSGGVSFSPNESAPTLDQNNNANNGNDRKIIRTYTVNGETKEYDATLNSVYSSVTDFGGYVSESRVNGSSYNNSNSSRQAYLVIKIPAENLDDFISQLGNALNVTSSHSSEQDVSEAYYSIEARMETLNTERDSLLAMMASIDTASDYDFWYTLQKRVSEIEQQIAEYEALLRSYDNKIIYSTVNLTVNEVIEYTPTIDEEDPTFFERIGEAFVVSWTGFAEFCMDLAVVTVYALPATLIFVIIPIIIIVLSVKTARRRKNKKDKTE